MMRTTNASRIMVSFLCVVLLVSCTPTEKRAVKKQEVVPTKEKGAEGTPDIEFVSIDFQFGEVDKGTKVEARYEFTNVGTADLKLVSVKPTCGCTVSQYTKEAIPPKGKGFVTAVLDTNRAGGNPVDRTIRVTTNDPDEKLITLHIKGHVKTDIDVPQVISFGGVDHGKETTKTYPVTVYKEGLEVTGVTSSSENVKASFRLVEGEGPTKKYSIDATLSKDTPPGRVSGILSITVKGKDKDLRVRFSGVVLGAVYVPSQLRFASFTQGESKFRVATIRKMKAPFNLKIESVKNESEFVTTELKETRPGQLYSLRVEIKTTAPVGQLTDTITIKTNNEEIPTLKVYAHARILAPKDKAK